MEKDGVIRNFKTQRVTKSGRKIDIILTRTAIRNDDGEIVGSSAIVKDVTQLRSIENQLSRAEHLASMGELAAALAHEIKNPLAGIKGAIEVILDQYDGASSHKQVLGEVIQEVKRIDRIVQDLLGYARPKDPNMSDINIREMFRRVALLFDRTIEQKKIHLEILTDPEIAIIYADENLLEQVMLNLVLNSLQALGDNGTLVLSTCRTHDANGVEITVQDNGPGIPPENLSRIFQPFFTTKKDGTGLGLATCKRIITDHGGTITVASILGMGATFRIWLPAKQSESHSRSH
jgi:signal transduction histidine kinase